MNMITEEMLADLRGEMMASMSSKRFRHTVAVEEMVARLCGLFCPENELLLRAAALLHDVTKEKSAQEQEELCRAYGLAVCDTDRLAPKTFHARTAAAKITADYPQFAHPMILDAVRWHTTGHAEMTLTEKLLFLADYIDLSRTYPNCVLLRRYFFGANPEEMQMAERTELLRDTLILAYDMTVRDLLEEGAPIAVDTIEARNELLLEKERSV